MTAMSSALPVQLRWLKPPAAAAGVTWGVPWSKGDLKRGELAALCLKGAAEDFSLPLQSRPAAYWPDGSIKWSLHSAVCPEGSTAGYTLERSAELSVVPAAFEISVEETEEAYIVDTGSILCTVVKHDPGVISASSAGTRRMPGDRTANVDILELRRRLKVQGRVQMQCSRSTPQSSLCAAEASWSVSASSGTCSAGS